MLHANDAGSLWTLTVDDQTVGRVCAILREAATPLEGAIALDAPVWASPAFGVEITLHRFGRELVAGRGRNAWDHNPDTAHPKASAAVRYRPLPTTPAAQFDLALLVPDGMAAATVEALIRRDGGELLESVRLFDEFRGTDVPAGYRSLAWALTFRHPERTLRDKEIEGRRSKLLKTLDGEIGVRPRAS